MNADLRASLLVGAVAAGLSMLVGLFSRVPFLPLLLRGIVFGLLFGGLAYGGAFLLRSFVPELFETMGAEADNRELGGDLDESRDSGVGSAVDIVLDGGDDEAIPVSVLDADEEPQGLSPSAKSIVGDEDAIEVEPTVVSAQARSTEPPIIELAADEEQPIGAVVPSRSPAGLDDLDILPDLDALTGSFGTLDLPSAREGSEEYASPGGRDGDVRPGSSSQTASGGSDPATLAAAVRTMLKRDQKG